MLRCNFILLRFLIFLVPDHFIWKVNWLSKSPWYYGGIYVVLTDSNLLFCSVLAVSMSGKMIIVESHSSG